MGMKQREKVAAQASRGAFNSNPVVASNRPSAGNPLAARHAGSEGFCEDPYSIREMANTAVRMFVSGEIPRADFEEFIARFDIQLKKDSELHRLITKQEQVGNVQFT